MKIAIGADHGGFDSKTGIIQILIQRGMEVTDVGCFDKQSVDYPDYAHLVAQQVASGTVDQGLLVCTTGIGMSIAANKFPQVRAALCMTPQMARMARLHNNANVLVLGTAETDQDTVREILDAWFDAAFEGTERHARRVAKIRQMSDEALDETAIGAVDPELAEALGHEEARERMTINLIASENYASRAVRVAQGSLMTNKYAEGYPGKRWYNGCEFVDVAERLAIQRACKLFGAEHANVQPHCGSAANMAVYFAMLQPGDTILAMSLAHGGHLTHGSKVNFSGRLFNVVPYGVNRETERIDYDDVARLAESHRPKLIVAGASAYPRVLDFPRLRQIADSVGALLMVDMAHIAGLVAGGVHPSPVPYSDFVTTTTHKTLRGPRSGMILCREKYAADIDRQVFPGLQGGPLMHTIAAKAVCFLEALQPIFRAYQAQTVKNAQCLAGILSDAGVRIVSGGTDNHLFLADLTSIQLTGREGSEALEKAGIIVNKNSIPFDTKPPLVTSGIRIGTPSVTSRGMREDEMRQIGAWIMAALKATQAPDRLEAIRAETVQFCGRYSLP
jgi:RpiB/LacA/LacB family sugar-phosphate isomerase